MVNCFPLDPCATLWYLDAYEKDIRFQSFAKDAPSLIEVRSHSLRGMIRERKMNSHALRTLVETTCEHFLLLVPLYNKDRLHQS